MNKFSEACLQVSDSDRISSFSSFFSGKEPKTGTNGKIFAKLAYVCLVHLLHGFFISSFVINCVMYSIHII